MGREVTWERLASKWTSFPKNALYVGGWWHFPVARRSCKQSHDGADQMSSPASGGGRLGAV